MIVSGKTQFWTPYSFAVYTCRVYGQVLDVARTTYMAASDWFTVEPLLFSDVGVFGVQNKMLGWMAKIACMWPTNTLEVEYYEWGCVSQKWLCFVAFYCWSMAREVAFWHLLSKESLRVSHSRESRGEKYELKLLNFYPKKPHKWRRFSIYTSSVMIFTPHERLLGQDICQTGVGCLC